MLTLTGPNTPKIHAEILVLCVLEYADTVLLFGDFLFIGIFCWFLFWGEIGSHNVAQAGLECATLLSNQVRVRSFMRV